MKATDRALREQLEELQASLADARREVAQQHLHAAAEQQRLSADLTAVQAALGEETQAVARAVRELRRHPRFSLAFKFGVIAHRFLSMLGGKIERIYEALPAPRVDDVSPEKRESRPRNAPSQTGWDGLRTHDFCLGRPGSRQLDVGPRKHRQRPPPRPGRLIFRLGRR